MRRSPSFSLPLGIDLRNDAVAVVAARAQDDGFVVCGTAFREIPRRDEAPQLDLELARGLRDACVELGTRVRRCVLAAPPGDVVVRIFRLAPRMRAAEAERAAALEADTLVEWPSSERLVALDPIPGRSDEMLLSVARLRSVERIVSIARAAGLRPVAVDLPSCAWRRAATAADALLDLSGERASLTVFGEPLGPTHLFAPRLVDERLAAQVRAALVEARRDGIADVQRVAVAATRYRFESLEELLRDDGYRFAPLRLGDIESPPWALAFGLATWAVAPRGLSAA